MRKYCLPFIGILCLSCSSICFAQYSDKQLYDAYLVRDMEVWERYIASVDVDTASVEERVRLLNYEYGYVAYSISQGHANARVLLDKFESNLEALRDVLPEATYLAYRCGMNSYELSLNKVRLAKYGKRIYSEIERAMSLNPHDPLVLAMKGNVEFYSPLGDKTVALECYQRADSVYHARHTSHYLWNVRAVQMTLVQCLEKTGQHKAAIDKCHELLREEPNFHFIRDVYLPELEKK